MQAAPLGDRESDVDCHLSAAADVDAGAPHRCECRRRRRHRVISSRHAGEAIAPALVRLCLRRRGAIRPHEHDSDTRHRRSAGVGDDARDCAGSLVLSHDGPARRRERNENGENDGAVVQGRK